MGGVVVGVGVEDLVVRVGVGTIVGVVEVGRVEISEIVEIVEIRVEVDVGCGGVVVPLTEVEEYRQGLLCAISACANNDIRGENGVYDIPNGAAPLRTGYAVFAVQTVISYNPFDLASTNSAVLGDAAKKLTVSISATQLGAPKSVAGVWRI